MSENSVPPLGVRLPQSRMTATCQLRRRFSVLLTALFVGKCKADSVGGVCAGKGAHWCNGMAGGKQCFCRPAWSWAQVLVEAAAAREPPVFFDARGTRPFVDLCLFGVVHCQGLASSLLEDASCCSLFPAVPCCPSQVLSRAASSRLL